MANYLSEDIAKNLFECTLGIITNGMACMIGAYLVPSFCVGLPLAAAIGASWCLMHMFYYQVFNLIWPNDQTNHISSLIASLVAMNVLYNLNIFSLLLMQLIGAGAIFGLILICNVIGQMAGLIDEVDQSQFYQYLNS